MVLLAGAGSVLARTTATWVITGVGVPVLLWAYRPRSLLVVALALAAVIAPQVPRSLALAGDAGSQRAAHDGGVHVTGAAAEALLEGQNPYEVSYRGALPDAWTSLEVGEDSFPNPVVDHMPYLPAAFLVAVPGVALEGLTGVGGDTRWTMGLLVLAALVVVARRPERPWARAATIVAFGSSFAAIYAAWGTNDVAAAALVGLAALGAARHPAWAAAALVLAVSYKAPLVVGLVPWSVWVVQREGWRGLARWWPLPVGLALTMVPFLLWSPGPFVDDTVGFWSGTTAGSFPASGLGLGFRAPGLMTGAPGAAITLGAAAVGLVAAVALVRRAPHPAVLAVAAAVALLGVLVPARTFQPNYLALVTGLLAFGWLAVDAPGRDRGPRPSPSDAGSGDLLSTG
ncbi:hypothetical protein PO878_10110 [Iamia majanohamensis]|uniref:DUF2029 domain-containing protein n=1 Tax=Iamia majanohamensis TaxID=467976 RepID=A0AAE9Y8V6_9ACTN|nr:hypothetical protein [Iamia majanohamensis]WCO69079.1 hypothetical protein PO878_10110 [Iamia majanohamensis]